MPEVDVTPSELAEMILDAFNLTKEAAVAALCRGDLERVRSVAILTTIVAAVALDANDDHYKLREIASDFAQGAVDRAVAESN